MNRKRLTPHILILVQIVILSGCEKTPFDPEYDQSAYGLGITVWANQAYYGYAEPVDVTFSIVNLWNQRRAFTTPHSQLYDLQILNQSNETVWQYGHRYGFFTMESSFLLGPHQQKSMVVTCEDTLETGTYTAIGWFEFAPSLKDTTRFIVLGDSEN